MTYPHAHTATKMKVLCLLLLFALPRIALSCSCVPGSYNRPRIQAIADDFCSRDVYMATVVGATCNCVPASGDANLYCQDYMYATGDTSVVNVGVVNRANLVGEFCRWPSVAACSELTTSLVGPGTTVQNTTSTLPPAVNTTDHDGYCFYSCPFNNMSSSEYIESGAGTIQPCMYTVQLTMVFKGNYTHGETLLVSGPDVLTSCGHHGRLLRLQEQYVVGIGGACNPIDEWSTVSSYSSRELEFITDLVPRCGALAFLPSLTLLVVLTAVGALLIHA